MLEAILEAWRTHDAINRYMLDNIPEPGLAAIPLLKNGQPGKGRDVARQFAHMVDVRVSHLRVQERALMKGVAAFDKGVSPSRAHLEAALEASDRGIEALFTRLVKSGEQVHKRGPLMLLAYFISHESHHRGFDPAGSQTEWHRPVGSAAIWDLGQMVRGVGSFPS